MFGLTEGMSYYVCQRYVNMGLGINGLYKLVFQKMGEPPLGEWDALMNIFKRGDYTWTITTSRD